MKNITIILFLFFTLLTRGATADVFEEIANSIRSGNAHEIANYFGASVDLTILNEEGVYSKAQAELILKDYFSKNPPKNFTLLHKGSSREGTMYAIGNMTTSQGKTYRISFYIKNEKNKNILQELRIEKE